MSLEFKLKGSKELLQALDRLGPAMRGYAAESLAEEAQLELEEAKRRVPYDTGALHDSAYRKDFVMDKRGISVIIGFGGQTAPYAVYVHEQLRPHDIGRAKFLESTVLESAKYLALRVAKKVKATLESRRGR